jgi:carboxymethylenebutenolidase
MSQATVEIQTKTGPSKTEIFTPDGSGPWPAVFVCFDAFGVRQSMFDIAKRISSWGYVVAVPDFFHEVGSPADLLPPGSGRDVAAMSAMFKDPDLRGKFFGKYYAPTNSYEHLENDVAPLLAYFDSRADVKKGGVGTTGYCMGGNMSLRIATIFGEKVKATAGFHPGGLVTDQPDSPHLRVGKIKSHVYLGPAIGDLNEEQEKTLSDAFKAAHVDFKIDQYDAQHGYAVADHDVYDSKAAEKHFEALKKFYADAFAK